MFTQIDSANRFQIHTTIQATMQAGMHTRIQSYIHAYNRTYIHHITLYIHTGTHT